MGTVTRPFRRQGQPGAEKADESPGGFRFPLGEDLAQGNGRGLGLLLAAVPGTFLAEIPADCGYETRI